MDTSFSQVSFHIYRSLLTSHFILSADRESVCLFMYTSFSQVSFHIYRSLWTSLSYLSSAASTVSSASGPLVEGVKKCVGPGVGKIVNKRVFWWDT